MRKEGLPGTHYLGNITVRVTIIIAIVCCMFTKHYSLFVAVHVYCIPVIQLWKCRWAGGIPFGCL